MKLLLNVFLTFTCILSYIQWSVFSTDGHHMAYRRNTKYQCNTTLKDDNIKYKFGEFFVGDEENYRICCLCNPGFYLKELCRPGNVSSTQCTPCAPGTYIQGYAHGRVSCIIDSLTSCPQGQVYVPGNTHEPSRCDCPWGYHAIEKSVCQLHASCPPGEGVKSLASPFRDTTCEKCPHGYHSPHLSPTEGCSLIRKTTTNRTSESTNLATTLRDEATIGSSLLATKSKSQDWITNKNYYQDNFETDENLLKKPVYSLVMKPEEVIISAFVLILLTDFLASPLSLSLAKRLYQLLLESQLRPTTAIHIPPEERTVSVKKSLSEFENTAMQQLFSLAIKSPNYDKFVETLKESVNHPSHNFTSDDYKPDKFVDTSVLVDWHKLCQNHTCYSEVLTVLTDPLTDYRYLACIFKQYPIAIFWDIENCRIPKRKSAASIVRNLRERFCVLYKEVKIYIICDVTKIGEDANNELSNPNLDVTITHVPALIENSCDKMIEKLIIDYATDGNHKPPAAAVLITGDCDLSNSLILLSNQQFHTLLLHNGQAHSNFLNKATKLRIRLEKCKEFLEPIPDAENKKDKSTSIQTVTNLPSCPDEETKQLYIDELIGCML